MVQPSRIFIAIKRYLVNCNLHGIRYLVEDGFHWTERVFWLITCALCWYGCALMVKDSLDGFYNRPVTFTVETEYTDWNIDFPSVSVCIKSHPAAESIASSLYNEMYGSKIGNLRGWTWLFSMQKVRNNRKTVAQLSKLTSDAVVHIYKKSTLNCSTFMNKCFWRSTLEFNCCDEFLPLKTTQGLCYVFNSIHTGSDESLGRFTMNQTNGPGYLTIGLTESSFLSPQAESVPTISVSIINNWVIPGDVESTVKVIDVSIFRVNTVYFTLQDIYNDPGLKYVSPKRRRCRFSDETEDFHVYERYSKSGCLIQLQMDNMLNYCGCISHLFPYKNASLVCNYTQVECLMENIDNIMKADDPGKRCLPSCEGRVIRQFQNKKASDIRSLESKISQGIRLQLLALPTSRSKRYVVRSLLDLVVAVGSTASLFMGAGILSLVEIPYWLLLRHGS